MKRSGIAILALSAALTVLALALGGDFVLFIRLQWYYLLPFVAILLVALLNTWHELAASGGRDRLCLRFVQGLASCAVCIGLLVTLLSMARTIWCIRHLRAGVGDVAVSLLPLLYCLVIAEVVCPVLSNHFGCRVDRADQAHSQPGSNETS